MSFQVLPTGLDKKIRADGAESLNGLGWKLHP